MFIFGNSMMNMVEYMEVDAYSHLPESSPTVSPQDSWGALKAIISVDEFMEVDAYSELPESSPTATPRDLSGALETSISVGKNPLHVQSDNPLNLMKELPGKGSRKKRSHKKVSSFLPNLNSADDEYVPIDISTLPIVDATPSIVDKQLLPLTSKQLASPLPEQMAPARKNKSKSKKNKRKDELAPVDIQIDMDVQTELHERNEHNKRKRHDDEESERKRAKKDKKRNKYRYIPERELLFL